LYFHISVFINDYLLNLTNEPHKAIRPIVEVQIKKNIAFISPANSIYLSISYVRVMYANTNEIIAITKYLRSIVIFIITVVFNYSTNIIKISDIKKSRGNYFAKKCKKNEVRRPHL